MDPRNKASYLPRYVLLNVSADATGYLGKQSISDRLFERGLRIQSTRISNPSSGGGRCESRRETCSRFHSIPYHLLTCDEEL